MKMPELRAETRISISQRGTLNSGDTRFPCLVQNMSDNGFLIICNNPLSVGQILGFRCELYPEKYLDCKIEARHISDSGVGTKIIEITQKGTNLCQLFLQEHYSNRLNQSG